MTLPFVLWRCLKSFFQRTTTPPATTANNKQTATTNNNKQQQTNNKQTTTKGTPCSAHLLRVLLAAGEVEPLLGHVDELVVAILGEVGRDGLVDRLGEVEHLEAVGDEPLDERRRRGRLERVRGHVVDALLAVLHAADIVVQRRHGVARLGAEEAQQLREARAVVGVLDRADLEVAAERLPEGLVVLAAVLGREVVHHLEAVGGCLAVLLLLGVL